MKWLTENSPALCGVRTILMQSLIVLSMTQAEADTLSIGQLRGNLGLNHQIRIAQLRFIIKKEADHSRLILGSEDKANRTKFMLIVDVPRDLSLDRPIQLDSNNHDVTLVIKTPQASATALSPVMTVNDHELEYSTGPQLSSPETWSHSREKNTGRRTEYRKIHPKWHNYTRDERMRQGEGVQVHQDFAGTHLTLRLFPAAGPNATKGFRGHLSGIIKMQKTGAAAMNAPFEADFRVQQE